MLNNQNLYYINALPIQVISRTVSDFPAITKKIIISPTISKKVKKVPCFLSLRTSD